MSKKMWLSFAIFFTSFISTNTNAVFFEPSPYTKNHGTYAYASSWNSTGDHLAIGGTNYPDDLIVYRWDGDLLTKLDATPYNNSVNAVDWSPNGHFLAVGGSNGSTDMTVYKFNGESLTLTSTTGHKSTQSHGAQTETIWPSVVTTATTTLPCTPGMGQQH